MVLLCHIRHGQTGCISSITKFYLLYGRFPKLKTSCWVPVVQPRNTYYMVISKIDISYPSSFYQNQHQEPWVQPTYKYLTYGHFPKSTSVTRIHRYDLKYIYKIWSISKNQHHLPRVPWVRPINTQYIIISPKPALGTLVLLGQCCDGLQMPPAS